MAGFLGIGNYAKPGKGVKKEQQEKKRFFQFFDLYFRKFWNLVRLNLLFILFCIPIVTIGPATAAMMKIVRYYNEGKPVFLFSDFLDAFKQNFLQSFLVSIINAILITGCFQGFIYYMVKFYSGNALYIIPVIILVVLSIIIIFSNFYIFLVIVTVDLKLIGVIKNAVMFMFIGAKTNFLTFIFTSIVAVPCFLLFPFSIPIIGLIGFSTIAMIVCFNSFQYIYKHLVKPYYDQTGIENPYEKVYDDEAIFEDRI